MSLKSSKWKSLMLQFKEGEPNYIIAIEVLFSHKEYGKREIVALVGPKQQSILDGTPARFNDLMSSDDLVADSSRVLRMSPKGREFLKRSRVSARGASTETDVLSVNFA
eukprot:scaffold7588_cov179-Ochromonas_danica.AAC.1